MLADHFGWKVGLPTYAVAGFVGYTRVRNNQHWLSDVAFGSALGILAGRTITAGHHHTAFTVMPTVTKHGAGLFVVRNFR